MLDVIIGQHTWNCQIRTHIYTEIHTHTHTQKQKMTQKRKKEGVTTISKPQSPHFGEHKRLHLESSKQNYYIISLRVIIKAILIQVGSSKPKEEEINKQTNKRPRRG